MNAINALLSVNHDPGVVASWLKQNNLLEHKLRYNCFMAKNANRQRGSAVANETLLELLGLLREIDDPDFDLKRLSFTMAASSGEDLKSRAKKEITDTVLFLLETYADHFDQKDILPHISEKIDVAIPLAIYRVKRQYAEALNVLTANGKFDIDQLQEFCRAAPEPPKAFSALLKLINPNDLVSKYSAFLETNMPWIDPIELFGIIPRDSRIKNISGIIRTAFNLLQQRKLSLEMEIALTRGMMVDLEYKKAVAASNYSTMKRTVLCAGCHQPMGDDTSWYTLAGGSDLDCYHVRCKPTFA
jgi:hypothetical protein